MKKYFLCSTLFALMFISGQAVFAQNGSNGIKQSIASFLNAYAEKELSIGRIEVESLTITEKDKRVRIQASVNCSYIPFTEARVKTIYESIRSLLTSS